MTVLVGIRCTDGIVIGSDSSATFGSHGINTIEQSTKKIEVIADKMLLAGTGQVGLGQRFGYLIASAWRSKEFSGLAPISIATRITQIARADFAATVAPMGQFGALFGFHSAGEFNLCEFASTDLQPELKLNTTWYASMGSGQLIADPFLAFIKKVFSPDSMPTVSDAIFYTVWAIQQTIELNTGGINGPIQISTLTSNNGDIEARILPSEEIQEHSNNVDEITKYLGAYMSNKNPIAEEAVLNAITNN